MLITFTVATHTGDHSCQLTLDNNTPISTIRGIIEAQLGISPSSLILNNKPIDEKTTIAESGIKESDFVIIDVSPSSDMNTCIPAGVSQNLNEIRSLDQIPRHVASDPILFQKCIKANGRLLQQLLHQNPTLAEAVLAEDTIFLRSIFSHFAEREAQRQFKRGARLARLHADPMNTELQKEIEDDIRITNVEDNMAVAIEHLPESFGRVVMLYISCEVNGKSLNAFVDSGAESTIMSRDCAERLGIMRLVDIRWSGTAKGVGTAKIIGRIHLVQIKIGNSMLNCSFTILDQNGIEFLFGLDMLRRHQVVLDLKSNCFCIGNDKVQFLVEKDLPRSEDEIKLQTPPASSASSFTQPPGLGTINNSSSNDNRSQQTLPTGTAQFPGTVHSQFSEDGIKSLTKLGFSRQEAINALQQACGNVEMAASYLFR